MTEFPHRRASLFLMLILGGCALQPEDSSESDVTAQAEAKQAATPALRPAYDAETLADLLIAEVAAQRNLLGVTMGYYAREARKTGDPKIAEQATRIAAWLNDPVLAAEMGKLWVEADPDDRMAKEMLALSYLDQGDADRAAAIIDELMASHPEQALARIVLLAQDLDQEANTRLLVALGSLTDRYPRQPALWYARALTLQAEEKTEAALDAADRALKLDDEHRDSQILRAQLLDELGRTAEAQKQLKRLLRKHPNAMRARVLYTRILIEQGDIRAADRQLADIATRHPEELDLRLSLALLALEAGPSSVARETLDELLERGYRTDEIHLYMARQAETEGNLETAFRHYFKVTGAQRLNAQVQAVRLLYALDRSEEAHELMATLRDRHPDRLPNLYAAESEILTRENKLDEALELLNTALGELPDNPDLLYARAMAAVEAGNVAQAEADLKRILENHPEDATVLNALGYTLADRTSRLEEAARYISAAYAQRPNDPAIMDSMGWVLYRQGRPDEALKYLQAAWSLMPDQEVAAHLGEVLWVLGQKEAARDIWRQGLKIDPDSALIPATIKRVTGAGTP